jgi:hypothetical protein
MIAKLINKISEIKTDINHARIQSVKNDYNLLTENKKARQLKDEVKADSNVIRNSYLLFLLGLLGLIASTGLSLAGGINHYQNYGKYAFLIAMIFIQVAIFVVSAYESIIKYRFNQHYTLVKICQILLLMTSIKYNYDFFDQKSIFTLSMCVILDCITIKFISLSYDFRHFKAKRQIISTYESNNNVSEIILPVQKIESTKVKQIEAPKEKEEIEVEDPVYEIEEKSNYQYTKKALDIENIRKYLDYLLENSKDDIAIGYKKVAESLGLTQGEGIRIYNKLKEKKYLVTTDRKTLIEKKKFNENDFEL